MHWLPLRSVQLPQEAPHRRCGVCYSDTTRRLLQEACIAKPLMLPVPLLQEDRTCATAGAQAGGVCYGGTNRACYRRPAQPAAQAGRCLRYMNTAVALPPARSLVPSATGAPTGACYRSTLLPPAILLQGHIFTWHVLQGLLLVPSNRRLRAAAATGALCCRRRKPVACATGPLAGARYRRPAPPADAAATGALRCRRGQPVAWATGAHAGARCAACGCNRYRNTVLPPVAGACYRAMQTPVAADHACAQHKLTEHPYPWSTRTAGAACAQHSLCLSRLAATRAPSVANASGALAGACYRRIRTPVATGP